MKNILVIEDDPYIARLIVEIVSNADYLVRYAIDKDLALTDALWADLVIVDVGLDGMDGIELLKEMRLVKGKRLPAIIETAHTSPDVLARIQDAGDCTYMPKPFSPREIPALIEATLNKGVTK